jgi:hypothetical protein
MKKPTARFASGGGLETLLVLLAVSTLAGSAYSLNRNNSGGRRLNGRHRGALRDGERQTHEESIAQEPAITRKNVFMVPGKHYRQNGRK